LFLSLDKVICFLYILACLCLASAQATLLSSPDPSTRIRAASFLRPLSVGLPDLSPSSLLVLWVGCKRLAAPLLDEYVVQDPVPYGMRGLCLSCSFHPVLGRIASRISGATISSRVVWWLSSARNRLEAKRASESLFLLPILSRLPA